MSLVSFCGKVAITVSILIVIAALVLGALLVVCVGIGAYESAANPHIQQDTARSTFRSSDVHLSVSPKIDFLTFATRSTDTWQASARGTAGISSAVRNITGG